MKKVFVYPNASKDRELVYTHRVVDSLVRHGCEVFGPEGVPGVTPFREECRAQMDFAVMLGGDGTILQGAHLLLGTSVPIVGINLGTLGYMAEVEPENIEASLEKVLQGQYHVEHRIVLAGDLLNQDTGEHRTIDALNEFVLHRNDMAGVLEIRVFINDTYIETFRADGVIIATPNGSTGYNLSAGGPILSPEADNIILTPLCSHSILGRSIVVTGEERLSFEIHQEPDREQPLFSADGIERIRLNGAYRLDVRKSANCFSLIRVSERNFFEVLRTKMHC